MKRNEYVLVFTTTGTDEEAHRIAEELLKQRRAACVTILPAVNSMFWWQGSLDSAQESLLLIKTKASRVNELIELITELHTYDTPEVIATSIIGGNPDYLEWIGKEVI